MRISQDYHRKKKSYVSGIQAVYQRNGSNRQARRRELMSQMRQNEITQVVTSVRKPSCQTQIESKQDRKQYMFELQKHKETTSREQLGAIDQTTAAMSSHR